MLESALLAVDENKNMTGEVKQDIKALLKKFSAIFSNISLENLSTRIKEVQIEKTHKLVSKKAYDYNARENKLCFSIEALQNGYNADHLMMSGLLCMMTAKDHTYGFGSNRDLICFNVGVTEMLSNFVVGNAGEKVLCEEELIATNIIAEVIGMDTLFKAYFTNDAKMIMDKIVQIVEGDENYARSYSCIKS